MIGIHDMGGMHHLGPVETDDNAMFHADWEGRVFGLQMIGAAVGDWPADEYRYIIERMPPADYLNAAYFVQWLQALEQLFISRGVIGADELRERQTAVANGAALPDVGPPDPLVVDQLITTMRDLAYHGGLPEHPELPRRYQIGDRVVAVSRAVPNHTRAPQYIWGRPGTVVSHSGVFSLPEAVAHRLPDRPEPVYGVRFEATDLWGEGAEPGTSVVLDLWESYMAPLASSTSRAPS